MNIPWFLHALCGSLPLLGMVSLAAGTPVISEFMADNQNGLTDEDGQTVDWIEIHNPDAAAADLENYSLTDDAGVPRRWIFPPVALPPDGRLIVFASGKNRRVSGAPLHANFSLKKDGEFLALVAPDGVTALSRFAPYPPQAEDKSYGLGRDVLAETILTNGASCRWKVPTEELPGWQQPGFDDSGWNAGLTGVGYDTKISGLLYGSSIGAGSNVLGPMYHLNATCYIRVPFVENNPATVLHLTLRMKYDDGFAAYLNGTKVAARNSARNPNAFSEAPDYTWDDAALRDEEIDLTDFRSLLTAGGNVLAIHGQNESTGNRDFLIVPALDVVRANNAAPLRVGYFAEATPNGVNAQPGGGFAAPVSFSMAGGFFEAPLNVTLTCPTADAEIRCTTDGSEPTATHGFVCSGLVSVTTTTVLRSVAVKPGWHASPVSSQSYLFPAVILQQPALPAGYPAKWGQMLDGASITDVPADYQMDPAVTTSPDYAAEMNAALVESLPVVSIATAPDPLFGSGGLYAGSRLGERELPVSLEYFASGGVRKFAVNCGLQMHGGKARDHIKKPFRLYFRKRHGTGTLRQPLFAGSAVETFDQLVLRPGGHDSWTATGFGNKPTDVTFHASYLRDQFLRQTAIDMGSLAPAGHPVHLYLNGLYWGVYDLHERPNARFFADHLGGEQEDWDVLHHPEFIGDPYALASGSSAAWDSVLAAVASGIDTQAAYQNILPFLDVNHYIDMLLLRMWASDYDWMQPIYLQRNGLEYFAGGYTNKNWYAGRRTRNGSDTFHFFPWDAEFSMGLSYLFSQSAGSLPPELGNPPAQHILDLDHTRISDYGGPASPYTALRNFPEFRDRFADRLQKHFYNNGALTPEKTVPRLQAMAARLDLPMVAESARWGDALKGHPDPTTFTRNGHWRPEIAWLKDTFLLQRNAIVLEQFRHAGLFPWLEAPQFSPSGGAVIAGQLLSLTNPNGGGGTIHYTLDGSDPMLASGNGQWMLVNGSSACHFWVPTSGMLGAAWRGVADPPNLASWSAGTAALGFDAGGANFFGPHFSTSLAAMQNVNATAYVRIPFVLSAAELASLTKLELRMKYDDGFAAFLNGTPVQRTLALGNAAWDSAATGTRDDSAAAAFQTFPLTSWLNKLVAGTNVLAVQVLNASAADDDLLLVPELIATRIVPGGVAPGTLTYSGPVALLQTGSVKARVRAATGEWSALNETAFIVGQPASAGNLVLSELHYHPAEPSGAEKLAGFTDAERFEFLELQNISAQPVELAGVHFTAGVVFDFSAGSISVLAPGERLLVASSAAALTFRCGAGLPIAGEFADGSHLSNAGERLALQAADGSMIFDVSYSDEAPWPQRADGNGYSLVLRRPLAAPNAGNAANWRLSVAAGGTPGSSDADSFAAWAARHGVAADAAADPDMDGLPLLLEYASGGSPAVADAAVIAACELSGNLLAVSIPHARGADDAEFILEAAASGMGGWAEVVGAPSAASDAGGGLDELTLQMPLPDPRPASQFLRLRCRLIP